MADMSAREKTTWVLVVQLVYIASIPLIAVAGFWPWVGFWAGAILGAFVMLVITARREKLGRRHELS